MALNGSITVATNIRYTPATLPDLSSPADRLARTLATTLADGSGAGQANRLWHDQRIVNASTNDDLDLAGGSLVDVFGQALTFARIKAMVFQHKAGANVLTIGNGGTNAFNTPFNGVDAGAVTLRPTGIIAMVAPDATGYVVTAGTGDILRVANGAGSSVTFDVYLIGATA